MLQGQLFKKKRKSAGGVFFLGQKMNTQFIKIQEIQFLELEQLDALIFKMQKQYENSGKLQSKHG